MQIIVDLRALPQVDINARLGARHTTSQEKGWKMVHSVETHLEQERELFVSSRTILLGFIGSIARYQHVAQSLRAPELFRKSARLTAPSEYLDVSVGKN
mmetsp:Transcript_14938/g.22463  ORF Transcript_14938/g.22463 Transcript_14938/m.22463 type:complete len:99 (-) Transcript_14938:28-324(-)